MGLERLIECYSEGGLSFIKSLLAANGIVYLVRNEHFGSLYPGSVLPFNTRVVMVAAIALDRAWTLLSKLRELTDMIEAS